MKLKIAVLCLVFSSSFVHSAQNESERVTNLVIVNDGMDLVPKNIPPWFLDESSEGALIMDLVAALVSNQLVLCTKSNWISLQNIIQIWDDYVNLSEEELLKIFESSDMTTMEKIKFTLGKRGIKKQIKAGKELVVKLDGMYERLMQAINQESDPKNKYAKAQEMVHAFAKELYPDGVDNLFEDKEFLSLCAAFTAYVSYKIILAYDYICKEVSPEFILFVPQELVDRQAEIVDNLRNKPVLIGGAARNVAKAAVFKVGSKEKDFLLGLKYSKLPDYRYEEFVSEEVADLIVQLAQLLAYYNQLGQHLLLVLQKLKIDEFQQNTLNLPVFNIVLCGHGDQNNVIAEIAIKSEKNVKGIETSDFLEILKFFNHAMRVKSLAIIACYPGGKKMINTFNISNQFNNINLEQITYPIIFVGSFSTATNVPWMYQQPFSETAVTLYTKHFLYGTSDEAYKSMYQNYFKNLNQMPSNYEGAAQVISGVTILGHEVDNINNYASIKYPHTSWFVPVELKTKDASLEYKQKAAIAELQYGCNLGQAECKSQLAKLQKHIKAFEKYVNPSGVLSDEDDSLGDELSSEVDVKRKNIPLKFVQKISQVEALATSNIKIDLADDKNVPVKIILLQANVIQKISFENASQALPKFLPVNHLNQNYVIEEIDAPGLEIDNFDDNVDKSFYRLIKSLLPITNVAEPLNLVIKKLQTKDKLFTNIYIFTQRIQAKQEYVFWNKEAIVSGYMYTGPDKVTKVATWPNDEKFPEVVTERAFSVKKVQEFITQVETKAREGLKSFENVQKMLAAKQSAPIPDMVVKSHEQAKKIEVKRTERKIKKENRTDLLDQLLEGAKLDFQEVV
jgi:hypothetical protein